MSVRGIQQRDATMRSLSWLFACAGLAAIIAGPASAQNPPVPLIDGPTYLMTYIEVIPSANARAIAMLKEYRDASRKEPGANYVDIYQEEGQSHRFILDEIWQSRGMAADHSKAAAMAGPAPKIPPHRPRPLAPRVPPGPTLPPPHAPTPH